MPEPELTYEDLMFPAKDQRVFDERALSVQQIADKNQTNRNTAGLFAKQKVKDGLWEQVWKRDNLGRPKMAYRMKKK